MSKCRTNGAREVDAPVAMRGGQVLPASLVGRVEAELEVFAQRMRDGLLAAVLGAGLATLEEFVQAEVTARCGPKGRHDPGREAVRHGTEPAKVPLGGRLVDFRKPRVRTVDGEVEVPLETWAALTCRDLLDEHTVGAMLAGVSTRNYQMVLEPAGPEIEAATGAVSASAVSRRFVAATKRRLDEFRSRPLDDRTWVVFFIDGFDLGGETLVGALGVDTDGNKVPLGVMHGSTENKTLCMRLLNDIEDRGFDPSGGLLCVIDGGKGIGAALKSKWGGCIAVHRCHLHKERNVLDLVPKDAHGWVRRKLRAAWANPDVKQAEMAMRSLAAELEKRWPDAAASLREGMADTLTIRRLGVGGTLERTLMSTNPVESMIDIVKVHARNVKRWQAGDMRLRWAAAGMTAAETQFRRVKGYRQLPALQAALAKEISKTAEHNELVLDKQAS